MKGDKPEVDPFKNRTLVDNEILEAALKVVEAAREFYLYGTAREALGESLQAFDAATGAGKEGE